MLPYVIDPDAYVPTAGIQTVIKGKAAMLDFLVCADNQRIAAEALATILQHGRPMTVKQLARSKRWEESQAADAINHLASLEMVELVVDSCSRAAWRPAADLLADLAG